MSRSRFVVACLCLATGVVGCGPTYVVVPPDDGVQRQRVVIHDTVVVQDTVRVREALPRRPGPSAPVVRVDTVVRTEVRTDTVYRTRTLVRTDTVVRLDTVIRFAPGPDIRPRRDTVIRTDTVTVTVTRVDTVRVPVTRVDTVQVTRVDTVQVAGPAGPKPRRLVLPPGHHPQAGQCRIWVEGVPPGRQADAAPCDQLGEIPAGAFILFGGLAWDFDFDWVAQEGAEPGSVPPEIVAVQKPGASASPDGMLRPRGRRGG